MDSLGQSRHVDDFYAELAPGNAQSIGFRLKLIIAQTGIGTDTLSTTSFSIFSRTPLKDFLNILKNSRLVQCYSTTHPCSRPRLGSAILRGARCPLCGVS